MYFIAVLCFIGCASPAMAMEQNTSGSNQAKAQATKQNLHNNFDATMTSLRWVQLKFSVVGLQENKEKNEKALWFEAPALVNAIESKAQNENTAAINQGIAYVCDTLKANKLDLRRIRKLCKSKDADIICPKLKDAYDAFKKKKTSADALEAVKLLTHVVDQASDSDLISAGDEALISGHLSERKAAAQELMGKVRRLQSTGTKSTDKYASHVVSSLQAYVKKLEELESNHTWAFEQCEALSSLQEEYEKLAQQAELQESMVITDKQTKAFVKQAHHEIANLKRLETVVEVIAVCGLIGLGAYRIWSERQKDKEQHQYGYMRAR